MFKKILIGIVVVVAVAVSAGMYFTGSAAKLTEYELGSDKVPSILAALGEERKVTNVEAGISGGTQYKQYNYETASMRQDLITYTHHLRNNGWEVTKAYDLNDLRGEMQLAKESADKGKILIMSVAFEQDRYAVRVSKLEGTLTRN